MRYMLDHLGAAARASDALIGTGEDPGEVANGGARWTSVWQQLRPCLQATWSTVLPILATCSTCACASAMRSSGRRRVISGCRRPSRSAWVISALAAVLADSAMVYTRIACTVMFLNMNMRKGTLGLSSPREA